MTATVISTGRHPGDRVPRDCSAPVEPAQHALPVGSFGGGGQGLDGCEDVSPLVRPVTVDVELAERAVPQDLTKRRQALSSRYRMAGGSSEVRMSVRQSGAAGNGALAPPHA